MAHDSRAIMQGELDATPDQKTTEPIGISDTNPSPVKIKFQRRMVSVGCSKSADLVQYLGTCTSVSYRISSDPCHFAADLLQPLQVLSIRAVPAGIPGSPRKLG